MKFLSSTLSVCLLLSSSQIFASRPAEDDPEPYAPPVEQSQSNIPAPESSTPVPADIPEAPAVQTQTEQTGDVIQVQPEITESRVVIFDFPRRGMDMSKVLNELGEPVTRHPAIGQPPITRWDYSDRSVFFEYSHVIHVVAR